MCICTSWRPKCSPREWGWTAHRRHPVLPPIMFPTRVGMDRRYPSPRRGSFDVPHASGDGPIAPRCSRWWKRCSPREWGWTVTAPTPGDHAAMFPTRVGMDRIACHEITASMCVPHASGDGPVTRPGAVDTLWCSPREWGWTARRVRGRRGEEMFPTRVGMDRGLPTAAIRPADVPHASGDGPLGDRTITPATACSPRKWGWTVKRAVLHVEQITDRVHHASRDGPYSASGPNR